MFEQASKLKLRFKVSNGLVSTEDLWDLPLVGLDDIARKLYKELNDTEVSFIDDTTDANKLIELKFNIVKHIIDIKKAAKLAVQEQKANAARKAQLMQIIESKQNAQLLDMSIDDLRKELESL
jgi:hypothetical protein